MVRVAPSAVMRAMVGVTALLLVGACGVSAGAGSAPRGAARGTVTGRLVREGGPIGPGGKQPGEHPLPGQVRFTAAGRHPVQVTIGTSGRFSVRLLPGRYTVVGRSPDLELRGRKGWRSCSEPQHVTVRAGQVRKITVVCVVP
ncbi:MAG TPA: hypothetical protein VLX31_02200 [Streptosporangiaceae bacterium]|nr:hypothetical protein [Streptosporangiaceae bacterium]